LAQVVRARFQIKKIAGQITGVDLEAGTLTLKPRRSEENIVIIVDENTRFRSPNNEIQGLEDLQAGMVGIIAARPTGDGVVEARLILVKP
jgi:hypothetical protein